MNSFPLSGKYQSFIKYVCLLIGGVFFCYILIRAIHVGATIDELGTINQAIKYSFKEIFLGDHPIANNHVLNTVLIKSLFLLGSDSLIVARLSNVLSFILYAYWGYKIVAKLSYSFLAVGCFLLLVCNPFLLDFFGLARGYGLSLAFMMGALYFGMDSLGARSISSLFWSLVLSSLAVLSLFSMIYFWLGLALVLNLFPLSRRDFAGLRKSLLCSFIIGMGLFGIIAVPVFRLIHAHALGYGGKLGFYNDTLVSLTRYSLCSLDITPFVHLVLNSFLGIFVLTVLFSFIRGKKWDSPKSLFLGVVLLSAILIVLAHYLAEVRYPIDRVALFLYPLLILSLCFCLKDLGRGGRSAILPVVLIAFSANFISKGNFYRTVLWGYDSHTEEVLQRLNEEGRRMGKVVSFACTPVIYSSVDYYATRNSYPFVRVIREANELVPPGVDYYMAAYRNPATATLSEEGYINQMVRPLDYYDKAVFIEYPQDHLFVFEHLRKR